MPIFYPVQLLADWIVYFALGLQHETHLADSLNFFIFDVIKIFILLAVVVYLVSFLRTYLPAEKVRKFLSGKPAVIGNILAALLGIATPFCTCSAVPLFLGLVQAGVPLGAAFSFLVSSPMVNEVALILLFGLFGWKIALLYAASGVFIATVSGFVIGHMRIEHLLEDFVLKGRSGESAKMPRMTTKARRSYAWSYTRDVIEKVWPYILLGVGAGALIHGYVPVGFLAAYAGADKWYAVPLATFLGMPLYANVAGIMPLVGALTEKGLAMGTVLSFMMSVTGLSFPEFVILKKVMKTKLIVIFAAVVCVGIMLTGYLFNVVI